MNETKKTTNNFNKKFTQISSNSHTTTRNQSLNKTYHSASYIYPNKTRIRSTNVLLCEFLVEYYIRIMDLSSSAVVVRFRFFSSYVYFFLKFFPFIHSMNRTRTTGTVRVFVDICAQKKWFLIRFSMIINHLVRVLCYILLFGYFVFLFFSIPNFTVAVDLIHFHVVKHD